MTSKPAYAQAVPTGIPAATIVYNFISAAEQTYLISKVDEIGRNPNINGWKELSGRRSMHWGGTLTNSSTLLPAPFPAFMSAAWPSILKRIAEFVSVAEDGDVRIRGAGESLEGSEMGEPFVANHCLVNEYLPGEGIMPHTDGPIYKPVVTTLSLLSHTILELVPIAKSTSLSSPVENPHSGDVTDSSSSTPLSDPIPPDKPVKILLPPLSLLILSSTLYSDYLHSIRPVTFDAMDELKDCVNWEGWWEGGAGGLDAAISPEATADSTGDLETSEKDKLEEIDEGDEEVEAGEAMEGGGRSKSKAGKSKQKRDLESLARGLVEIDLDTAPSPLAQPTTPISPATTSDSAPVEAAISPEISHFVAKRKLVEFADGWERGRRVSLTCRRVIKVRKGMKLG